MGLGGIRSREVKERVEKRERDEKGWHKGQSL